MDGPNAQGQGPGARGRQYAPPFSLAAVARGVLSHSAEDKLTRQLPRDGNCCHDNKTLVREKARALDACHSVYLSLMGYVVRAVRRSGPPACRAKEGISGDKRG
jgi:hypothetical protein